MIKYVEGDLFKEIEKVASGTTVMIPHVCNDVGVFGAGFVVPLANHFPSTREAYKQWHEGKACGVNVKFVGYSFVLGHTQEVLVQDDPQIVVYNMIAQHEVGGNRPLRYNSLSSCMDGVAVSATKFTKPEVHAPLFGAGLAGGNWDFIELIIKDAWLDLGIPVTVYYMLDRLPPGWTPPKKKNAKK